MLQVQTVEVCNFKLTTGRRLDLLGQFNDLLIVEVQASYRIVALGLLGLFFKRQHLAICIKFSHAIALWILHTVSKYRSAFGALICTL